MDAKSIILLIVASGCIGVLIGLIPMHFAKHEKKAKKEIEIIRCKDCRHWKVGISWNCKNYRFCDEPLGKCSPNENDYCSAAERKDDEQNES